MIERDVRLDGVEAFEAFDPNSSVVKLFETFSSIGRKAMTLAELIKDDHAVPREHFDKVLFVPRGALGVVNLVARPLRFRATDFLSAAIGSYEEGETKSGPFKFGQMPNPSDVEGNNILVIDEVCETGGTLGYLKSHLVEMGATAVKTGVLHYKPDKTTTGFIPDWHVMETGLWVQYPWEEFDAQGRLWFPDQQDALTTS